MIGGLLGGIPYVRTTKTEKELDAMSTAQIVGLAPPDKRVDLVAYLERRFLARYIMPDTCQVDSTH